MEDKVFQLLEKMYIEFGNRFNSMEHKLDSMEHRLGKLEAGQLKIEIAFENDIKSKLQAPHERAQNNTAKLDEHAER